jgi:hypothetical protein
MQVPKCLSHDESQFHFVVHGYALWAEHRTCTGKQDGGWRLQEEEGLLWRSARELLDVVGIVSAYAYDLLKRYCVHDLEHLIPSIQPFPRPPSGIT